jgi:hypothetical protein
MYEECSATLDGKEGLPFVRIDGLYKASLVGITCKNRSRNCRTGNCTQTSMSRRDNRF